MAVAAASSQSVDHILINGKIITVSDDFQVAEAIAIRGERILAVASFPIER